MPATESAVLYKAKVVEKTRRHRFHKLLAGALHPHPALSNQAELLNIVSSDIYSSLSGEELSAALRTRFSEVLTIWLEVDEPMESWPANLELVVPDIEESQAQWMLHLDPPSNPDDIFKIGVHAHALPSSYDKGGWELIEPSADAALAYSEIVDALERAARGIEGRKSETPEIGDEFAEELIPVSHNEFDWIEAFANELSKHRGKWVALSSEGIVAASDSMKGVFEIAKSKGHDAPFILEIPEEGQEDRPLIA